ncbi:MAG: hypothetical protein ABIF12_02860 [bacterium]
MLKTIYMFCLCIVFSILFFNCVNLFSKVGFLEKENNENQLMSTYKKKLEQGLALFNNKKILHTSPHPDDVTLGYLPYITWLLKNSNNEHCFLTMTSGSNAVRNHDLLSILSNIEKNILENKKNKPLEDRIFNNIVNLNDGLQQKQLILNRIRDLRKDLGLNLDNLDLKILKGVIREFEEESVWSYFGIQKENIIHFRSNFYLYNTDGFSVDIKNFYELLLKIDPDIVTLAIDPKGIGPLTHYKTFVVIQKALQMFYEKTGKNIKIIGYRNVWQQFEPNEANIFFPVYQADFNLLNEIFLNCYKTQVDAMFPNSNYKGNFSDITIQIIKENLKKIEPFIFEYLGNDIKGICFLKKMNIKQILNFSL